MCIEYAYAHTHTHCCARDIEQAFGPWVSQVGSAAPARRAEAELHAKAQTLETAIAAAESSDELAAFDPWESFTDYTAGTHVRHLGRAYKCLIGHASTDANPPGAEPDDASDDGVGGAGGGGGGGGGAKAKASGTELWKQLISQEQMQAAKGALASAAAAAAGAAAGGGGGGGGGGRGGGAAGAAGKAEPLTRSQRKRLVAELRRLHREPHPACDVYPTEVRRATIGPCRFAASMDGWILCCVRVRDLASATSGLATPRRG